MACSHDTSKRQVENISNHIQDFFDKSRLGLTTEQSAIMRTALDYALGASYSGSFSSRDASEGQLRLI